MLIENLAHDLANQILTRYWNLDIPVNPIRIANYLGYQVFYDDKNKCSYSSKEILIDENLTRQEKRQRIAELLCQALTRENQFNTIFASYLLIPEIAFNILVGRKNMSCSKLVEKFDVPIELMTLAINRLEI